MDLFFGKVTETQPGKVKVLDLERDLASDWMQIIFPFVGTNQALWTLPIGAIVIYLEDDNGRGVVLGQGYDKNNAASSSTGVYLKQGGLEIKVDSGLFTVGNGLFLVRSDKAETVLGSILDALVIHTHPTAGQGAPSVPTNASTFTTIKSNLSGGSIRTEKIKGE
jgi:hypothetical protein